MIDVILPHLLLVVGLMSRSRAYTLCLGNHGSETRTHYYHDTEALRLPWAFDWLVEA